MISSLSTTEHSLAIQPVLASDDLKYRSRTLLICYYLLLAQLGCTAHVKRLIRVPSQESLPVVVEHSASEEFPNPSPNRRGYDLSDCTTPPALYDTGRLLAGFDMPNRYDRRATHPFISFDRK